MTRLTKEHEVEIRKFVSDAAQIRLDGYHALQSLLGEIDALRTANIELRTVITDGLRTDYTDMRMDLEEENVKLRIRIEKLRDALLDIANLDPLPRTSKHIIIHTLQAIAGIRLKVDDDYTRICIVKPK